VDQQRTEEARQSARELALAVYEQDPSKLNQLTADLRLKMNTIVTAPNVAGIPPEVKAEFEAPPPAPDATPMSEEDRDALFEEFREAISGEQGERILQSVNDVLVPYLERGLLDALPEEHTGNLDRILVVSQEKADYQAEVPVSQVLIAIAEPSIKSALESRISSPIVAQRIYAWLKPRLPKTLTFNRNRSEDVAKRAVAEVKDQLVLHLVGDTLAVGGQKLDEKSMHLLRLEYEAQLDQLSFGYKVLRSLSMLGLFVALYTLCGFYVYFREPLLIRRLGRLTALLAMVVLTVAVCILLARDELHLEMIPLLLFGMTVGIAYHAELALLVSAAVTLIVTMALGFGLPMAVILMSANTGAILTLGRIRGRSKLLFVGACAGVVAFSTTIGVGVLIGRPSVAAILEDAAWFALWCVLAGSLMTCLLPFIERLFSVQTDLSLIELGDPAHPLLQELVRRAPGTYNHSITVASLAESAAEAIGARGLLVRVGAYFHDIGKMLKPGYFIENQAQGDNRHESLVPAMSTLVIIAHVKDGADLARKNHLPESIIDFIQQHHGTTLVEYFYQRASEQRALDDPDGRIVDESSFRYPGPKPQNKEAAVLMVADAVESASRVLVEPTPSRIENLVTELTHKRLMDGQFDECGLTLQEIGVIRESLIKSLTAVYHGRVKYPDQQTA
jgi:hypothetical protein